MYQHLQGPRVSDQKEPPTNLYRQHCLVTSVAGSTTDHVLHAVCCVLCCCSCVVAPGGWMSRMHMPAAHVRLSCSTQPLR
jgi:hypothetical protein